MKLNLGCGKDKIKGYINVDFIKENEPDVLLDLNNINNYPWKKDSVEEVIMQDIFEHLEIKNRLKVLNKLIELCKKDCIIKIRVPHQSSCNVSADLTHRGGFSWSSFEGDYMPKEINIIKRELQFPKPYRWLGFNKFFSKRPLVYERFFYGLFPCGNIYFELKVIK